MLGAALSLPALACATSEPDLPAKRADAPSVSSTKPSGTASGPPAPSRAKIEAGTFNAGTAPGRFDRKPELEPALALVALGEFEIDVAAYPGGSQPPLLDASREAARELCARRGGRLCTELEWERACKGPESFPFPNGASFDPTCTATGCPSGFGVLGMGALREWTASELGDGAAPRAVVRGASEQEPDAQHRCARRAGASVEAAGIGFRCCYGAPNAARVASPVLGPTYGQVDLPVEQLANLLRSDPVTRELGDDVTYFSAPQAAESVLAKGPGDRKGFLLTSTPLLWNPVPGASFLVITARSGADTSFVVVYHDFGDGQRSLESSFVMRGEPGPVALAYNGYIRPRLHFSTCWGCPGETGKILYRDPDHAVVLQP